jgi:hypothetical protein
LIDVEYTPCPRFRFRLDGSKLAELTGFDLTGKYSDQIESEKYRKLSSFVYGRVATSTFAGAHQPDWISLNTNTCFVCLTMCVAGNFG